MIRGYGDNMDVEVNCQSAERKTKMISLELVLSTLRLVVLKYKQSFVYCSEDFFPSMTYYLTFIASGCNIIATYLQS